MATETRKASTDVVGDMVGWGNHFCLFYETKQDLLDTLISYCKSGLEKGEYCLWVVAEPVTIEEAIGGLKDAVPELDRHLADSNLELASARDWFLEADTFDGSKAKRNWHDRLARAGAKGYRGVRATGDTTWLGNKKDWTHWCNFEDGMNEVFRALVSSWATADQRLAMLCTYPLEGCGAPQILDVVRTHQFVLARRYGNWDILETAGLKQAKAEIQRLNDGLERRVVERTSELIKASEALREAQAELMRVSRLTTMGELAASIAHEVNQPLTAITNNSSACLRLLADSNLDPAVLHGALEEIVADSTRASAVLARIRGLIEKAPAEKNVLDINELIQDVLALAGHELQKNRTLVELQLTKPLPLVVADRIQLQQVLLNLIMNGIEAMTAVTDRPRVVWVQSGTDESGEVLVAVRDSGTGLGSDTDRLFTPFFTTKPKGMGMGLQISRSIIEAHGGRLWAEPNVPYGAVFSFTVPRVDGARRD
jgi:signal transduction histidine kinase